MVDFVLVMLLLVPIVFGVLQLGLTLYVRNTLAAAASEGARQGAVLGNDLADGESAARRQLRGVLAARYAESIRPRYTSLDGAPAVEVRITAEVPALGLGGPALTLSVSGHAAREMP